MPTIRLIASVLAAAVLAGCASPPSAPMTAHDAFFQRVRALCGQAFEGRVVEDTPVPTGADPFATGPLVMHVRECDGDTLRIPFHVGEDRSRTWVLTRTAGGLRLKHDHRHADGAPDVLTMYGGETTDAGIATRQAFPADAESIALFTRTGRSVSNANVWAMEIDAGRTFAYELARPQRRFRVEFDLTRPVPPPPPPWGAD